MFAVPEVDDDINVSTPVEVTKTITQPEATKESLPSPLPPLPPPPPAPSIEKVEKNPIKMQVPPPAPPAPVPVPSKQHRSRRSLFHRNTIHICDQIVERV